MELTFAQEQTAVFIHPKDSQSGKFLCDKSSPMPKNAPINSSWLHTDIALINTPEALLIRIFENNLLYRCENCNVEWIINQDVLLDQCDD